MFKAIILLAVSAVVCHADPIAVNCKEAYPFANYKCIGNPLASNPTVGECGDLPSPCERTKCVFKGMGWYDGETINKGKIADFFENFGKNEPEYAEAVAPIRETCLTADLPSGTEFAHCPTYDIKLCTLRVFFKNLKPSVWSSDAECVAPRQYVEACL